MIGDHYREGRPMTGDGLMEQLLLTGAAADLEYRWLSTKNL